MSRLAAALVALLLGSSVALADACPPGHADLARGINVPGVDGRGNWTKAAPAVMDALIARGLTHVRLPVRAENLTARFSGAATIEATVADVGAALSSHLARGVSVILDLHGAGDFGALTEADPAAAGAAVVEAWTRLAPLVNAAPEAASTPRC